MQYIDIFVSPKSELRTVRDLLEQHQQLRRAAEMLLRQCYRAGLDSELNFSSACDTLRISLDRGAYTYADTF